ncbi:hypothetical protein E2L08_04275 [Palleronia sediminis]|uniref:Uncharacterized protein n=1 Tax=Palleronia sediminis TaxID=2547833 RepID=A0A4R6AJH0_9RHOB|nr:hypothetical protein [Palleronia sediminis]TDL81876.1 hypothetical protein E2L08_04275 [Palleronia sediminis]
MKIMQTLAVAASAALVTAQAAMAGSFAPAVDCSVTPNAPECAVVTAAPMEVAPMGLGTAGYIAGGLLAAGVLAAVLSNDDDDDDSTTPGSQ